MVEEILTFLCYKMARIKRVSAATAFVANIDWNEDKTRNWALSNRWINRDWGRGLWASIQCHFPSRALFRVHFWALFWANFLWILEVQTCVLFKIPLGPFLKWHRIDALRSSTECYNLLLTHVVLAAKALKQFLLQIIRLCWIAQTPWL